MHHYRITTEKKSTTFAKIILKHSDKRSTQKNQLEKAIKIKKKKEI